MIVYFLLLFIVVFLYSARRSLRGYFDVKEYTSDMVHPNFYNYCDQLFAERIVFYKNLNQQNKAKFIYRVNQFIVDKEWKGFYDFEVQSEHRALIAACAIQLTFGLKEYKLEHIERIFIAPSIFYSRLFEKDVKGLTMPNAIYFSWEDCKKGMDIADDAFNLCLHEFAHAMDIAVQLDNADVDNVYMAFLNDWEEQSDRVFNLMNDHRGYEAFLREYAKVNKHEFFAVCVENFFEKGKEFKEKEPTLFLILCRLLNANPLNPAGNYKLEQSFLEMENDPYIGVYKRKSVLKLLAFIAFISWVLYMLNS